jgi:hypothetical protein
MRGVINDDGSPRTLYTNDAILPNESKIRQLGENYWQHDKAWDDARQHKFHPSENPQTIDKAQMDYLYKIKELCDKHGTNVKIAIGPSLNMTAMNHKDVEALRKVFGQNNVIDFSDRAHNKYSNYHNFYDNAHYRISVGREMMKELYL